MEWFLSSLSTQIPNILVHMNPFDLGYIFPADCKHQDAGANLVICQWGFDDEVGDVALTESREICRLFVDICKIDDAGPKDFFHEFMTFHDETTDLWKR